MNQELMTNLTGAAAVGMAVAVWWTHPAGAEWGEVQIAILGTGIGAAIKYAVGWVDLLKNYLAPKA